MDHNYIRKVFIAELYYIHGYTQYEISNMLNIARSTVSGLLSDARESGIVNIKIRNPIYYDDDLAYKIADVFGIDQCYVIPAIVDDTQTLTKIVAAQAAQIVEKELIGPSVIGISSGPECYEFAASFSPLKRIKQSEVVPLTGNVTSIAKEDQVNEIVRIFAEKINGVPYFIHYPMIAESKEYQKLYAKNSYMQSVVEKWNKLDLAIINMNTPDADGDYQISENKYFDFAQNTSVTVCGRRIDASGVFINDKYDDLLLGIDENGLHKAKRVVCIAAGEQKVLGTLAVLRSNIINTIIMDETLAKRLLEQNN